MKIIRTLFIAPSANRPSTRVRIINLIKPLVRHGIQVELRVLPKSFHARRRMFQNISGYDIIVLQKKLLSLFVLLLLRRASKVLVYDFDDAVFLRDAFGSDNASKNWFSKSRQHRFKWIIKKADLVLAGNAYLEHFARNFNPNVAVIPSSISLINLPTRNDFPDNPEPVVGWIGSRTTVKYILSIEEILARVMAIHPFQLCIISDVKYSMSRLTSHHIVWNLERQDIDIAHFDIGIMPLSDDPWTRGKCAYKLLQYMAAEIPFVASAVGMNVDVSDGNTTGFAVRSEQEFIEKLLLLLKNKTLRQKMGKAGRIFVEKHYTTELISDKIADLFKNLKPISSAHSI